MQNGFCCGYAVRKATDKGLGVFATEKIKEGSTVWRYVPGRYEVFDEQSYTSMLKTLSREKVVYELTHTFGMRDFPDAVIRILDEGALINHSERANLATNFAVPFLGQLESSSPNYLEDVFRTLLQDRFALVATRDISEGEEFTNNYLKEVFDPPFYLRLCDEYDLDEDYLE